MWKCFGQRFCLCKTMMTTPAEVLWASCSAAVRGPWEGAGPAAPWDGWGAQCSRGQRDR